MTENRILQRAFPALQKKKSVQNIFAELGKTETKEICLWKLITPVCPDTIQIIIG